MIGRDLSLRAGRRYRHVMPWLLGALLLAPGSALSSETSVVPSEVCIDGNPVQVLTFDELPLEDPVAAKTASLAGVAQSEARISIALGFVAGIALTATGVVFGITGATTDRGSVSRTGAAMTLGGLGLGFSGIFGGRWLMKRSASMADDAIERESMATGRDVRWRTDEEPCDNE